MKENKILWNLMAVGSFCSKVIDLGSSLFLHLLFSSINLTLTES